MVVRGRHRVTPPPPRGIQVHVEELVLYGFRRADGPDIAEAVRGHLTELLASEGLPPSAREPDQGERTDTSGMAGPNSRSSHAVGARIARTVYEGLAAWRP
jgi:hypothetical protein